MVAVPIPPVSRVGVPRASPNLTFVSDRLRLGVVGCGNIADLNVAGYLHHPACDVVAVCDRRADAARDAAGRWGVAAWHDDLDDLLARDDVDAVEVLTPTNTHTAIVSAAIEAGKHVSCQKPLATTVADVRALGDAARRRGVVLRTSECYLHYPPLELARSLIEAGAIGEPTVVRIKTVVGTTDSDFQRQLDVDGYWWRFDDRSPGGHLFDDVVHKFACARWLPGRAVTSVQSVVRQTGFFFEAPTVALFEYDDPNLLGMMEVSYAPDMHIPSRYFGADEFFEVQGTDGWIWVTRCTGEMLDLPPVVLYGRDGTRRGFTDVDADWGAGFRRASAAFVDGLLAGDTDIDMTPEDSARVLQLCFAVYQASNERRPVDPSTITTSVSPDGWPYTRSADMPR